MNKLLIKSLLGVMALTSLMGGKANAQIIENKAYASSNSNKVEIILIAKDEPVKSKYDGAEINLKKGEFYFELSDGSWGLYRDGAYVFQPIDLGDWSYELKDANELERITNVYMMNKNYGYWY